MEDGPVVTRKTIMYSESAENFLVSSYQCDGLRVEITVLKKLGAIYANFWYLSEL